MRPPFKLGTIVCVVLLAGRLALSMGYVPSWPGPQVNLAAQIQAVRVAISGSPPSALATNHIPALPPSPAIASPALVPVAMTTARPPERRPSVIQAVSIPPVLVPLASQWIPAGLPSVLTPGSGGGVEMSIPAPPASLVRPPRMPEGAIPGILATPAGKGPFPAVILLHGCNGAFTVTPDWAYRLNGWGYAVLMPDSLTPRGIKSVCAPDDQPKVTARDRIGDVGAAATWLRTRPDIDPSRIAVLGLSHGGATAALAVQTPYAAMRLRAAIDYYGPCANPQLHGATPLLVLAGEADDWGDPAARCQAYGAALRPDQPFEMHSYPGVFHAFDSGPAKKIVFTGHVLAYDQAAAEDSFNRVRSFLDRQVRF